MESPGRLLGLLVAVLAAASNPSQATLTGQLLAGCTRGLAPPCTVACSVPSRLCRACCAAVAAFTQPPGNATGGAATAASSATAPVTTPISAVLGQYDVDLNAVARCLAPCVRFTVRDVKKVLEERPAADVAELAAQLAEASSQTAADWTTILNSGRVSSMKLLCEQGALTC